MKYYGSFEIAKALGRRVDFVKISTLLNLIEAPMVKNGKRVGTYCLSGEQVKYLDGALEELKKKIKK